MTAMTAISFRAYSDGGVITHDRQQMTREQFDLVRAYNLAVIGAARQFSLRARQRALGDGSSPEDAAAMAYANGAADAALAVALASARALTDLEASPSI